MNFVEMAFVCFLSRMCSWASLVTDPDSLMIFCTIIFSPNPKRSNVVWFLRIAFFFDRIVFWLVYYNWVAMVWMIGSRTIENRMMETRTMVNHRSCQSEMKSSLGIAVICSFHTEMKSNQRILGDLSVPVCMKYHHLLLGLDHDVDCQLLLSSAMDCHSQVQYWRWSVYTLVATKPLLQFRK